MEIGSRERFGVSLELSADHGGPWLFGRLCYWIGGAQVGRYDESTSLRDVLISMEDIPLSPGRRIDKELFENPKDIAYYRIDTAIYGFAAAVVNPIEIAKYVLKPIDKPERFVVGPEVDVFDDFKIFLVEWQDQSRFLYKRIDVLSSPVEFCVGRAEFDDVVEGTLSILKNWHDEANES